MNRWNRTFRILFPDVDDDALPSALADDVEAAPYFAVAVDPGLEPWEGGALPQEDANMEE